METQTTVSSAVEQLFRQYEQLAQQKDFAAQAKLFSHDLIGATPLEVQHHSNNVLSRWIYDRGMAKFYSEAGLRSVKIVSMEETLISANYSSVKVRWAATFEKTGDTPIEYDITYIVRDTGKGLEIVMFIAHEDEMTTLRRYGIID